MHQTLLKNKAFWQAAATLIGTIIGAGVLGIPYAIARVGLWPGLFYVLILGLASVAVNLMIAEFMLRTRMRHQLAGLIEKYLGHFAKRVQTLAMVIGYYSALTAYIIGSGRVLYAIFEKNAISEFWFSIGFLALGAVILFFGLKLVKVLEFYLVMLIVLVIGAIAIFSLPFVEPANFYHLDWSSAFLPYGVILFAFGGTGAIFSMREILRGQEKLLRPAVILGSGLPILLYGFFAVIVMGVTGLATTPVATVGLGIILGPKMVLFGNLFALLAMSTSFFTVGLALRQMYDFDFNLPKYLSWLLVVLAPLLIFLFISRDFIQVIGIAGSVTFGLAGILTVLTYWRAKKHGEIKPAFVNPDWKIAGWLLIVMFVLGIVYTAADLVGG